MNEIRPTMVFIPGLLSDAVVWQAVADELATCLAVINRGVSEGGSITDMARAVLDDVTGPLTLAGHSMGARVAMEAVRLAPRRVHGLVLASTGVHTRKPGEAAQRQTMIELAYEQGMGALAHGWLPRMVAESRRDDTALMSVLQDMVMRADAALHERQLRALLNRPDARPGLAKIECPVLLLVGREDRWSPLAQHEEMAAALANAALVVIEDAGHFAPIEQPAAVSRAVRDWIGASRASGAD